MRLTEQDVKDLKELCNPAIDVHMCNLLDTVEVLQTEINQRNMVGDFKYLNTRFAMSQGENGRLKGENRKLKRQIAALQQEKLQRIREMSEQWAKEIVRADGLQKENERLKEEISGLRYSKETALKIIEKYVNQIDEGEKESEQLQARAAQMREALKKAREILQDMVDVAEKCGSAYLYRRDTEKVIILLKQIAEVIGE